MSLTEHIDPNQQVDNKEQLNQTLTTNTQRWRDFIDKHIQPLASKAKELETYKWSDRSSYINQCENIAISLYTALENSYATTKKTTTEDVYALLSSHKTIKEHIDSIHFSIKKLTFLSRVDKPAAWSSTLDKDIQTSTPPTTLDIEEQKENTPKPFTVVP